MPGAAAATDSYAMARSGWQSQSPRRVARFHRPPAANVRPHASVAHANPLCEPLPLASQSRVRTPLKTVGTAPDAPVQERVGRPKRGVAGGVGHVCQRRSPQSDVGCTERTTRALRIHFYSELHRSPQMFHAHRVNGSREVLTR